MNPKIVNRLAIYHSARQTQSFVRAVLSASIGRSHTVTNAVTDKAVRLHGGSISEGRGPRSGEVISPLEKGGLLSKEFPASTVYWAEGGRGKFHHYPDCFPDVGVAYGEPVSRSPELTNRVAAASCADELTLEALAANLDPRSRAIMLLGPACFSD